MDHEVLGQLLAVLTVLPVHTAHQGLLLGLLVLGLLQSPGVVRPLLLHELKNLGPLLVIGLAILPRVVQNIVQVAQNRSRIGLGGSHTGITPSGFPLLL